VSWSRQILYSPIGCRLIGFVVAAYIRLVRWTSRLEFVGREPIEQLDEAGQAMIGATWHGRLMLLPYFWYPRTQPKVLISRHGDGAVIAGVLKRFGIEAVRGSSERSDGDRRRGGAQATLAMLRVLKAGQHVGLTPDGPRGPRMRLAPGVVSLAQLSGAPVIPAAFASSRRRLINSWDRFLLAYPFSRIVFVFGAPIYVPRKLTPEEADGWRQQIEDAINRVTAEADARVGQTTVNPAPRSEIGEGRV
jgi:lysophospholipid acyltransferase (LPLAT)-like uncharacterized protein